MKRRFSILAAVLLAGAVFGRLDARPDVTLRISVVNTDVSAEPVYAESQGYFKSAGLADDITTFSNGAQVLDGVASGSLDAGFVNIVSAIDAIQKGKLLTIVAPATIYDRSAPITVLVQAVSSNFTSGRDLDGKTLGVPAPNDLGMVSTRAWVDATGGDSRTIRYVTGLPSSQIAAALAGHRVDAAETAPILAQRLVVSPATAAAMIRARYGETLSPALIQPIVDLSAKYGILRPMRAAALIGTAGQ